MRKNNINIPSPPCFQTSMTVQIGDINYGGHAGNERYLLFAQETRLRFLETIGCSEMKFGDYGLVLAEATLEYFHELFFRDAITIHLSIGNIGRASFGCYYSIEVERENIFLTSAQTETKMVCFDYQERKVKSINPAIRAILEICEKGNCPS
jgi:YbgC/YbaW family acyl-CoA thioester hydrolase